MGNLYTTTTRSTLLVNKLREIISEIQTGSTPVGNTNYQTYDEVTAKVYSLLSKFYSSIDTPIFVPRNAIERIDPEKDDFNLNFQEIGQDLEVLFREFENLEDVLLGGWNFMVSRSNRLKGRLKQAASRLGDLSLYSSIKIGNYIFVTDSFNNLERIESRSPLLKEPDQLEINQEEGILTLPIDTTYSQQKISTSVVPTINSSSNGVIGNNHEYSTSKNYDLSKILDYNADTWFEYERVVNPDDGVALQLDITINLGSDQIINFIRINPNNFGTKTDLEVVEISTSKDGNTYSSISADLLAKDDIVDPSTGSLKIAPSTSKFSGQGLYSFFPRKARYVRIILKQSTPYLITTFLGQQKWRYAIGLRDIWIERRKYKAKGELISKAFSFTDPVRKVVIETEQQPSQSAIDQAGTSSIAQLTHSLSPDNGVTWYQIRPKESSGLVNTVQSVPELLDFNGVDKGTIKTKNPVSSLRYRIHAERNSSAFAIDTSTIKQKEVLVTELHQTPTSTPFIISLQNAPIANSVKLVDPFLGSRGIKEYKYSVQIGNSDESKVFLPFAPIYPELTKSWDGTKWNLTETNPLTIKIGGVEWSRGLLSSAGSSSKYYQINSRSGELTFGDGVHGKAPGQGAHIEAYLSEERIFPSADAGHAATLKYPVSSDPEEVELYIVNPKQIRTTVLGKGANIHELPVDYLDETADPNFSDLVVFQTKKTFIDGSVELSTAGDYSIDFENGVVYSYSSTATNKETSIRYRYFPRDKLTSSSFVFQDTGGIINTISISNWKTIGLDSPETVPASVYYFNLGNLAIVKGSLRFSGTNVSTVFKKEVPFVDGRIELLGVQRTTQKLSSITAGAPGTQEISLNLQISSATDLAVEFSDRTVFETEKAAPEDVTSSGDYYIYRTAGSPRILVYVNASVTDPGYVSYFYADPNADLTGAYSVNYERGEVYTHTITISGLSADYRYTDYRIRYPIARLVDPKNYTVNTTDKTLLIKDREIIKRMSIERSKTNQEYYRVSYKYLSNPDNIEEYEDFYTPVLASYKLKIVPQSKIAF